MTDTDMKILIVDDYKTMLRIIRNLLKQIGFENVDEAIDGETALEKLQADDFDFIISDWNMEPMTGLDLLKAVRADADLYQIPFLLVTAESANDSIAKVKDAGVSGYIIKPFNGMTLKAKIDAIFAE